MINVKFKVFEDGEVIALFPDEAWQPGAIASYQHIGQHGGASPELMTDLEDATLAEYKSLLAELESIGYEHLHVLNGE